MKDIVVLKDVNYLEKQGGGVIADTSELNELAAGACAIVTNDGTLVTTATVLADIASATEFELFVGVDNQSGSNPDIYARKFGSIPRDLVLAQSKDYAAPANQIFTVGNDGGGGTDLNLPAVLVPGEIAEIRITREEILNSASPLGGKQDSVVPHTYTLRAEYRIETGDAVADVVTALVAKINNHPMNQGSDAFIVATSVNADTGIQLESTVYGQTVSIGTDELLRNASITETQEIDFGNGTGRQAREQEIYASSRHGNSSQYVLAKQLYDVAYQSVVTETYDVWSFAWNSPGQQRVAVNNNPGAYNELIIYFPEGGSDEADLKAVFNLVITSGGTL